jgi:hypothetical protein
MDGRMFRIRMYAMRIFGCWGKMPQQAGTSPNSRFAQLDNGTKRPLVSCYFKNPYEIDL